MAYSYSPFLILYANEAHNKHKIVLWLECTGLFEIWTKILFSREKQLRSTKYKEYFWIFALFFWCNITSYMAGFLTLVGAGTRTPACKHLKKTISHSRMVILNKCSQLGIWRTRRVFNSTLKFWNGHKWYSDFPGIVQKYWIFSKRTISPNLDRTFAKLFLCS